MSERRALLAKVHVARKQMALDEADYRAIIQRVAQQASAATCSDAQLVALLKEFHRLGWQPQSRGRRPSDKPYVRKIHAIWGELRPLLDDAGDEALRGFVQRQTHSAKNPDGISDPEWLSPAEATKVIRGLQGWLARVREKREAVHA